MTSWAPASAVEPSSVPRTTAAASNVAHFDVIRPSLGCGSRMPGILARKLRAVGRRTGGIEHSRPDAGGCLVILIGSSKPSWYRGESSVGSVGSDVIHVAPPDVTKASHAWDRRVAARRAG